MGGLDNRHLFLETENAKIKILADSASGKGSLLDLQSAAFLLYSQVGERGSSGVSSCYKGTNSIMETPPT
jgi:hypothetical protein